MKLSSETLAVLQNFAKLNQGIEFKKGNKISTISTGKSVLAKATLKDEFPEDFCVYDLNQFLAVHNIFKDTELKFEGVDIIIKSPRGETSYRKTEKSQIVVPPEKELALPSVDISFTLTEEDYSSLLKLAATLQSPHIAVESKNDKIVLKAFNAADNSAHTHSLEVGNADGKTFKMVFLTDNLRMIGGTYNVEISSKGLASFKNTKQDLQYWVATEAKFSKFGA
jgi:hypothetical protein